MTEKLDPLIKELKKYHAQQITKPAEFRKHQLEQLLKGVTDL